MDIHDLTPRNEEKIGYLSPAMRRESTRPIPKFNTTQDTPDLGRILKRLYNLELLATTQPDNQAQIAGSVCQTGAHADIDRIGDT